METFQQRKMEGSGTLQLPPLILSQCVHTFCLNCVISYVSYCVTLLYVLYYCINVSSFLSFFLFSFLDLVSVGGVGGAAASVVCGGGGGLMMISGDLDLRWAGSAAAVAVDWSLVIVVVVVVVPSLLSTVRSLLSPTVFLLLVEPTACCHWVNFPVLSLCKMIVSQICPNLTSRVLLIVYWDWSP